MTIFDVLAPTACLNCNRLGSPICITCRGEIPISPRIVDVGFLGRSLTDYAGTAANLINEVKERGRTQLLNWIVEQFDEIELGEEAVLVAMPSSRAAWRSRGFVPAEELASRLARRRLLRHEVRSLSLTREAADQVPLNRAQRNENRQGSMVSRPISGQVLIVDDIVTSGASLREAKRAIEAAGGEVVGFLTFAQTILENRANRS